MKDKNYEDKSWEEYGIEMEKYTDKRKISFDELKGILKLDLNLCIDDYRFNFISEYIYFLVEGEKNKFNEFRKLYEKTKPKYSIMPVIVETIMKYREIEIEKGRGQDITLEDLKLAYEYDDYSLRSHLMYLFVEHIPMNKMDFIKEKINQNVDGLEKLYNSHMKKPKAPIMNRILHCL
ncbi:hypothetical protein [Anaerosalibacter sp. Marseille-P3206]|uniref:hypothetical protein n=1 Tax=Anaerosalibacter sp. Marseille-P3206 TaxID=1871005 RepID=UPI000985D9E2|nr:hypothetical protein [Anaerosalibacter sp. Marseille-P3206]